MWWVFGVAAQACAGSVPKPPFVVPVVVVCYYPLAGDSINIAVTGDWGRSLAFTRAKTDSLTKRIAECLEEGSRFRGYKNPAAKPSLKYKILHKHEFFEPLPLCFKPGHARPVPDYYAVVKRIDAEYWVEKRGVKEIWLWAYHGGVLDLWESNMAGPFGDVSNSDRDPNDLPTFRKTYTLYHYNYQRGLSEAIEDHMHQIEAVLNFVDGRDTTPEDEWPNLLFWGKFVGSDKTHKIVRPGCGWAHYPPNAERDYDWKNPRLVWTDIEDWRPDGTGQRKQVNCQRWNCNSLDWFILWMQSLPGADNGLEYDGRPLTNWWIFIGDFDAAMKRGFKLVL
jgi:hypothetical protein